MPLSHNQVPLSGSVREPLSDVLPGARAIGPADPSEEITVTLVLRPEQSARELAGRVEEMGRRLPKERQYESRQEFIAARTSNPDELAKIEAFANQHGLTL